MNMSRCLTTYTVLSEIVRMALFNDHGRIQECSNDGISIYSVRSSCICPVICLISPAEKYEQFKATPTDVLVDGFQHRLHHINRLIPVVFVHQNTTADTEDVTFLI